MVLSRRAYRTMLRHDGLWWRPRSRLRLWAEVLRFFGRVVPHMARCCLPGHDPRTIADPPWVTEWIAAYRDGAPGVPMLDTQTLGARLAPVAAST
jgi:hypothetical protein